MPSTARIVVALSLASLSVTACQSSRTVTPVVIAPAAGAPAPEASPNQATVAAPKTGSASFFAKHESFLARGKEGPIGVLFLGDSITEQWKKAPEIWQKYYAAYRPANFGIGGDRTQHVLWRIENGELEGINPKVVVMMIGTNNSAANSADEIAEANRLIVREIQRRLPRTKILLLAIFPRGPRPQNPAGDPWEKRMEIIRNVNTQLARLDDGRNVRFLDIGPKFLAADGTIPADIMPDQLHLSAAGYEIWAEAMQPLLEEMVSN